MAQLPTPPYPFPRFSYDIIVDMFDGATMTMPVDDTLTAQPRHVEVEDDTTTMFDDMMNR
jgi:hypothetical protein